MRDKERVGWEETERLRKSHILYDSGEEWMGMETVPRSLPAQTCREDLSNRDGTRKMGEFVSSPPPKEG